MGMHGVIPGLRAGCRSTKHFLLSAAPALAAAIVAAGPSWSDEPGTSRRSLTFGGVERSYLVHPPHADIGTPAQPLVIALHGGRGDSAKMERLTGFSKLADRGRFIVAYPDAVEGNWNDGRAVAAFRAHREEIDDVGFIAALIDALNREFSVDLDRVYVAGVSNGAMMAQRLACELTDRIAAVASVIGALPENLADGCAPTRPIAVMMVNGTSDGLVPWEGGEVRAARKTFGRVLSVPASLNFWIRRNACAPESRYDLLADRDPGDGTRVFRHIYEGCAGAVRVVLYEVRDGGHTWPGRRKALPQLFLGRVTRDIEASTVIWEFFQDFRRP